VGGEQGEKGDKEGGNDEKPSKKRGKSEKFH